MRAQRGRHGELGTAAIELALLLPVITFMMFLVAEAGRALYQYNTLSKSVRDGAQYLARYGMVVGTGVLAPTDAEETTAKNLVIYGKPAVGTALLPDGDEMDIDITYQKLYGSGTDNAVTVTATYTYQPLSAVLLSGFTQGSSPMAGAELVASIRMRGV